MYTRWRAWAIVNRADERWRARKAADLTQQRSALRLLLGSCDPRSLSLQSGQGTRAWRTQGVVEGQEQTRVVVWPEALYEGQRRGLEEHLGKARREMAARSPHPRRGEESLRREVARWLNRQYVRQVL